MKHKIPFTKLNINNNIFDNLKQIFRSGVLSHGSFTSNFEKEFSNFTKIKYCTTVANCTAGLHLICLALNLKKNDEVIVPAMTHAATGHAVEYTGAKAKFVDVDPINGNIDYNDLKNKITSKTKAIIVVHVAGKSCDMSKILKICKKNKIFLIEDCAHSLGTIYKNKHVGSFGVAGAFSFYPTKQITTGEGGMVVSNNKQFIKKISSLKAFGLNKQPSARKINGQYDIKSLGYNYRISEISSAIGLHQLLKYDEKLILRKKKALHYIKNLSKSDKIIIPKYSENDSYFIFQFLFQNSKQRLKTITLLKKNKIGYSIHYATPLPFLSYYKKKYPYYKRENFKNSIDYSQKVLSLPIYSKLKYKEINLICDLIIKSLKN